MCPSSLVPALLLLAWMALSATQQASEVQTSNSAEPEAEARSEYGCLEVPEVSIEDYLTLHEYQRGRSERPIFNNIKWVPITAFYGFRVACLDYVSNPARNAVFQKFNKL